jgi:multiple sugar transport system substrate-binding protein
MMSTAVIGVALSLSLAACSTSGPGQSSTNQNKTGTNQIATPSQIAKALQKRTTLTMWGWAQQDAPLIAAFEKAYPKITVNLQNEGSSGTEYTKLQNVIKAGSGVPDVAQIEYSALPNFVLSKSLVNLSQYGQDANKSKFSTASWTAVTVGGSVYSVPQDSGPLEMFYRPDVFNKLGLSIPKTWNEYIADAKKIHAADPNDYIAADAGDGNTADSMIWQAGGRPYSTSGTKVSINLEDQGTKKFSAMWGQLISQGLIDTKTAAFTPDWFTGLADGKYATYIAGGWGSGSLINHVPTATGEWRAALVPQYSAGDHANGEDGGSSTAVLGASSHKLAAIGFAQWFSQDKEANQLWVADGATPSMTGVLTSSAWLNQKVPYFGGQQIYKVFAQASKDVSPGWQFLPFQVYANSIFADTVGQAYATQGNLQKGLTAWGTEVKKYGTAQGFTIVN